MCCKYKYGKIPKIGTPSCMSLYKNKTNLKGTLKLSQPRIPTPKAYSKPYQTTKIELFAKIGLGKTLHLRCLTGF